MTAITELTTSPQVRPRSVLQQLLRNPAGVIGLLILLLVIGMALLAPWLYPGDPLDMVATPLLLPGAQSAYPLGTDAMGRDVIAGIFHGARVSLLIGVSATVIGLLIGTLFGSIGGYFGGVIDNILVRITALFQTMPAFLLVIILLAIATPSVSLIALSIGITSWPTVARLVRAEFRTLRDAEFVLAARAGGFSAWRIIFQEILPNALPAIIVTSSVMVASAILMESALAFLGLGDPNNVSWGSLIGSGREMLRSAWYLTAEPGLALVITILGLNLLGDALNDAFNPRLRKR
ncbi:ABC transporter permease [Rouxiella silvae]|uniref:ABC transporter permease n=1 Tax=Rouxiella silvae TaxID=1646373 RepID=A0AA40X3A1_9GAMM|nr:ABC transporter permease [Rouxiella silvae]MBF6637397.1 ABC transporter permease [Rouxiella silvae]ORJ19057.1 ABC transporter permease [Rouxiella silvae]